MCAWPHAPIHRFNERGTYMVTGGTYQKAHFFDTPEKRSLILNRLMSVLDDNGWLLQAWAVLVNHYHFIAISPESPESLPALIKKFHGSTGELTQPDSTIFVVSFLSALVIALN